jgi:DNA primase
MAGRIPKAFIDELIARADIVELIGARVPLKKAGREYKACCPFHNEKTPSFWVSPDKQFYHCFGCGVHGTALGFLMDFDKLPFPEAVEELAGRLGLVVPHEGGAPANMSGAGAETARLYELLGRIAEHYHANLTQNVRAREYATRRGLTSDTLERFRIGYASDSWNELLRRFGAQAQGLQDLQTTGMIIKRQPGAELGEGFYDRFRDRLMFPIRDARGRVMAFGGRVLDQGEPKYLNSPETALFHKGQELYGLYEARQSRQTLKRLLVVEGYMDTVRLHQAGLSYAVATLGTATTPEHLRRAFRLVSELAFCFDGDRAGRAAAARALSNVLPEAREGREIRFLFLPEGEDPDSLVGSEGAEPFERRISEAVPLSEYLIEQLAAELDLRHADGQARLIARARPLLDKVPAGVYRDLLLDRIAQALGRSAEQVRHWLTAPDRAVDEPSPVAPRAHRAATAPGRGSLITQSIGLLLHFPSAAAAVSAEQVAALTRAEHAGVAVLHELLTELRAQPATTMAQTLERWRERHEYRRLCELAAAPALVPDAAAAARELSDGVARLLHAELRQGRLEALITKARAEPLDASEKLELQALTTDQGKAGGA